MKNTKGEKNVLKWVSVSELYCWCNDLSFPKWLVNITLNSTNTTMSLWYLKRTKNYCCDQKSKSLWTFPAIPSHSESMSKNYLRHSVASLNLHFWPSCGLAMLCPQKQRGGPPSASDYSVKKHSQNEVQEELMHSYLPIHGHQSLFGILVRLKGHISKTFWLVCNFISHYVSWTRRKTAGSLNLAVY